MISKATFCKGYVEVKHWSQSPVLWFYFLILSKLHLIILNFLPSTSNIWLVDYFIWPLINIAHGLGWEKIDLFIYSSLEQFELYWHLKLIKISIFIYFIFLFTCKITITLQFSLVVPCCMLSCMLPQTSSVMTVSKCIS